MPINESNLKLKARLREGIGFWDLTQEAIKEQKKMVQTITPPQVIDINNPPKVPYIHQAYPKALYHHKTGHVLTVADSKEEVQAQKKGFKPEPSPEFDYSQVNNGRAVKITAEPEPVPEFVEE